MNNITDLAYNQPNNYKIENEDHINLSIQSCSQLGKMFDPNYIKIISYPYIGKFNSVMSLWYWLLARGTDNKIRKLVGKELFNYVKDKRINKVKIDNFKAIIAYATWIKIKQYPEILKQIKELDSNLVLLSYYVDKSTRLRIRTAYSSIIIAAAQEIIAAVKEDREPNFDSFARKGNSLNFYYLKEFLVKNNLNEYLNDINELDNLIDVENEEAIELSEPEV